MTLNLKWHEISSDMKSRRSSNLKWHQISTPPHIYLYFVGILSFVTQVNSLPRSSTNQTQVSEFIYYYTWLYVQMSNVMKCNIYWYVKCHEMLNVTKCWMSWNVKCHEMLNVECHNCSLFTTVHNTLFNVHCSQLLTTVHCSQLCTTVHNCRCSHLFTTVHNCSQLCTTVHNCAQSTVIKIT